MAEDSKWGMVIHYPIVELIHILKQGGVGWLRTEVHFDQLQGPGQTPVEWKDVGIKVGAAYHTPPAQQVYFGIIPNYPKWISDGRPLEPEPGSNDSPNPPWLAEGRPHLPARPASDDWNKRYDYWRAFVQNVVQTFGAMGVRYFNIGNEPNDPHFFFYGIEEYLNLLLIGAQVVHAAGYKVCGPDLAVGGPDPWTFLKSCLQWLGSHHEHLDVVTIHGYCTKSGGANELMNQLRPVNGTMRNCGVNAPVWLTETGLSNFHFPNNPAAQSQRVKDLCGWIGPGPSSPLHPRFIQKIFFYVWSDDAGGGKDAGKYAWLSHQPPGGPLQPIACLWDAYKSVIEKD